MSIANRAPALPAVLCAFAALLIAALMPPAGWAADRQPPTRTISETRALFDTQRYDEAFASANALHDWGETALHYELGYMLDNGLGTPVDRRRALSHYRAAAHSGHVEAMHALAEMYKLGEVVPRNATLRCDWLERAAAREHPDSIRALAHCYGRGRGRPLNERRMLELLHRAAANAHAPAIHDLLDHYRIPERRASRPAGEYAQAVEAALHGDSALAARLARRAIAAGDYRAYGPLGDALRQNGLGDAADLMLELGRLFDSFMAYYATAQLHIARGAVRTGCGLHLDTFERGFARSGVAAGRCYQRGDLAADAPQARACALFAQAHDQADAAAAVEVARCQYQKAGQHAAEALTVYASGVQRDATVADPALETRLCGALPRRTVAGGLPPGAGWNGPASLEPGDAVCLTATRGESVRAYVPRLRWLGDIPARVLQEVSPQIDGLAIEGLNRERVRRLADAGRRPMLITPGEDRFWLDADRALRFIYGPTGEILAAQLIESNVFERARFQERVLAISADAGATDSLDDSHPLTAHAAWSTSHWHTELVLDLTRAELRQRIERR